MEPGVVGVCEQALALLEGAGLVVEPHLPAFDWSRLWRAFVVLRQFSLGGDFRAAYADTATRALMKPELQWELSESLALSVPDVQQAVLDRTAWYDRILEDFDAFDYLALPTAQLFPFPIEQPWPREIAGRALDTYHRWMEVVIPGTLSGCPVLSIPAGFSARGLPMGLQLIGRPQADVSLLQMARLYEQICPWIALVPPLATGPLRPATIRPAHPGADQSNVTPG
jgi:amidase